MKIGTEVDKVYAITIDDVAFYFPRSALKDGMDWPEEITAEMSGIKDKMVPFAWRLAKVMARMRKDKWFVNDVNR